MAEALNDEADCLAVLRDLIREIQAGDYVDRLGHPLTMAVVFLEAQALLELKGVR